MGYRYVHYDAFRLEKSQGTQQKRVIDFVCLAKRSHKHDQNVKLEALRFNQELHQRLCVSAIHA